MTGLTAPNVLNYLLFSSSLNADLFLYFCFVLNAMDVTCNWGNIDTEWLDHALHWCLASILPTSAATSSHVSRCLICSIPRQSAYTWTRTCWWRCTSQRRFQHVSLLSDKFEASICRYVTRQVLLMLVGALLRSQRLWQVIEQAAVRPQRHRALVYSARTSEHSPLRRELHWLRLPDRHGAAIPRRHRQAHVGCVLLWQRCLSSRYRPLPLLSVFMRGPRRQSCGASILAWRTPQQHQEQHWHQHRLSSVVDEWWWWTGM